MSVFFEVRCIGNDNLFCALPEHFLSLLIVNVFQLMQLKLISMLFPTSDMHHHVVTPTMLFMSQLITQVNARTHTVPGFQCFKYNLKFKFD